MCKDVGASSQSNLQKSKGFSGVKTDIVIELLRCINAHLFCLKAHFSIKVAEKKKKKKKDRPKKSLVLFLWSHNCTVYSCKMLAACRFRNPVINIQKTSRTGEKRINRHGRKPEVVLA